MGRPSGSVDKLNARGQTEESVEGDDSDSLIVLGAVGQGLRDLCCI